MQCSPQFSQAFFSLVKWTALRAPPEAMEEPRTPRVAGLGRDPDGSQGGPRETPGGLRHVCMTSSEILFLGC